MNVPLRLLSVLTLTFCAGAVFATDGLLYINQACAVNGGCFSGDTAGSVTETTSPSVSGTLAAADVDAVDTPDFDGETLSGSYGSLEIAENGGWTYTMDNRGDALTDGQTDLGGIQLALEHNR